MVTVELAAALPVLVVVTWSCVLMVIASLDRIRCADAAREAALAISLGTPDDAQRRADAAAGRHVALSLTELPGHLLRVQAALGFALPGTSTRFAVREASVVSVP